MTLFRGAGRLAELTDKLSIAFVESRRNVSAFKERTSRVEAGYAVQLL